MTGKYVPELAELIVDKNKDHSLFIDLRGILVCLFCNYKNTVQFICSEVTVEDFSSPLNAVLFTIHDGYISCCSLEILKPLMFRTGRGWWTMLGATQ